MGTWTANMLGLGVSALILAAFVLAMMWRVGSWRVSPAASLIHDEGLPIGSRASEIAAHRGADEFHLTFGFKRTFLVFGAASCLPCKDLMVAAATHPATRDLRLVLVADSVDLDIPGPFRESWEIYSFDDERLAREQWRARVSPYFYLIDEDGTIMDKGIGSHADHLDRLLALPPKYLGFAHMSEETVRL